MEQLNFNTGKRAIIVTIILRKQICNMFRGGTAKHLCVHNVERVMIFIWGSPGDQMAVAKSHWAKGIEQEFAGKARQGDRIYQFDCIENISIIVPKWLNKLMSSWQKKSRILVLNLYFCHWIETSRKRYFSASICDFHCLWSEISSFTPTNFVANFLKTIMLISCRQIFQFLVDKYCCFVKWTERLSWLIHQWGNVYSRVSPCFTVCWKSKTCLQEHFP